MEVKLFVRKASIQSVVLSWIRLMKHKMHSVKKKSSAILKKIDKFYGIGKPKFVSPFFGFICCWISIREAEGSYWIIQRATVGRLLRGGGHGVELDDFVVSALLTCDEASLTRISQPPTKTNKRKKALHNQLRKSLNTFDKKWLISGQFSIENVTIVLLMLTQGSFAIY